MTSQDNTVDMVRLELLLREHFARTDKQLAEIRKDNAEFHALMVKEFNEFKNEIREDINNFKAEVRGDISSFKAEVNNRFDRLEATVGVMQNDITGLKHNVAGLYHWDYWLLSIILVVFAMPQIVAGLKALFSAIAEGIAGIVSAFRGGRPGGQ